MEVKSFKTLEFNKIIDKLQNYAGSELEKDCWTVDSLYRY